MCWGFYRKLTKLKPRSSLRWLNSPHSRWNNPALTGSARETACGPVNAFKSKFSICVDLTGTAAYSGRFDRW